MKMINMKIIKEIIKKRKKEIQWLCLIINI